MNVIPRDVYDLVCQLFLTHYFSFIIYQQTLIDTKYF